MISVDTKKKELVGDFKNAGREWRPKGAPEEVRVHDFLIKELGRAMPYGVYDVADNAGWVSVGMDHDTAEFAVQTIRRWWSDRAHPLSGRQAPGDHRGWRGQQRLPGASVETRTAAAGQRDRHRHQGPPFPARHQQVEQDRASPVLIHQPELAGSTAGEYRVIVDLIGATTTHTGLKVHCELDTNAYPKGITVTDEEMAARYQPCRVPRRMELHDPPR